MISSSILNLLFHWELKAESCTSMNYWAVLDSLTTEMGIMNVFVEIKTWFCSMSSDSEGSWSCTARIPVYCTACFCWNNYLVERFVSIRAINGVFLIRSKHRKTLACLHWWLLFSIQLFCRTWASCRMLYRVSAHFNQISAVKYWAWFLSKVSIYWHPLVSTSFFWHRLCTSVWD